MIPQRRNLRIGLIGLGAVLLSGAAFLVLKALEQNISYFYTPADLLAENVTPEKRVRLGGLVETGSVKIEDGINLTFNVVDGEARIAVSYTGIRPDLFREGQGVIAQGRLNENGMFVAETILAKHDENYVPRELTDIVEHGETKAEPSSY